LVSHWLVVWEIINEDDNRMIARIFFILCLKVYSNHYANYKKILNHYKTATLDIVLYEELEGRETVCYIKTFWLKIFQRKWKQYYSKLMSKIQKMKQPKSILKREIQGKKV
jgi:hypothetical protein